MAYNKNNVLALKIAYELAFEINIALMEIQIQNEMVSAGILTTTKKEWTNN